MTKMITACLALVGVFAAGPVLAHHAASSLGTVRITQPVMAGGTMLQPGTYEIRDTGEHVTPMPGQSADAQARVEFLANGMVVARDVAELMPGRPAPVGTSGGSSSRPVAQLLKGGDFLRVSTYHAGERYLIYLPVAP